MDINTTLPGTPVSGTLGKPSFRFDVVEGKYRAMITFPVNTGEYNPTFLQVPITFDKWNDFNTSINNTWRPLFEELKKKYDITNLIIPDDVDSWFLN